MKSFILIFFMTTLCTVLFSREFSRIQNNSDYYYGIGIAENSDDAYQKALQALSANIYIVVEHTIITKEEYHMIKGSSDDEIQSTFESVIEEMINLSSVNQLSNISQLVRIKGRNTECLLYLLKSDWDKIQEERQRFVFYKYDTALEDIEKGNLGIALKNLYHAQVVLKSLPISFLSYKNVILDAEIPKIINNILTNTKFTIKQDVLDNQQRTITFDVSYKQHPVNQLDYLFFNGTGFVASNVNDGTTDILLLGNSIDLTETHIDIEYRYEKQRNEMKIVEGIWQYVIHSSYNNRQKISLNDKKINKKGQNLRIIQDINISSQDKKSPDLKIKQQLEMLLDSIKQTKSIDTDIYFQKKFNNLMTLNRLKITQTIFNVDLLKTATGWELRPIPVIAYYPTLNKFSNEYLVIDFDENGNLFDINIATYESQYNDFTAHLEKKEDIDRVRQIIKFLEKYRTAYLTRDMDTLDKIFDDNARIIVGRMLPVSNTSREFGINISQPQVEYLEMKKNEFLQRQKDIFIKHQDIHLEFSNMNILRHQRYKDVYGVNLRQFYNSSIYSDEGYLFLFIDFDKDQPTIHVRAWQPQEWDQNNIIRLSNFTLVRGVEK